MGFSPTEMCGRPLRAAWPSGALLRTCVARGSNAFARRRIGLSGLGAIDTHSADSDVLVNLDQRAVSVGLVFVFY
jgi:hypothetical protein